MYLSISSRLRGLIGFSKSLSMGLSHEKKIALTSNDARVRSPTEIEFGCVGLVPQTNVFRPCGESPLKGFQEKSKILRARERDKKGKQGVFLAGQDNELRPSVPKQIKIPSLRKGLNGEFGLLHFESVVTLKLC